MRFTFDGPPELELGMPIEYYRQRCETLHDSSIRDLHRFMRSYLIAQESRNISLIVCDETVVRLEMLTFPGDTLVDVDLGLPMGKFAIEIQRSGYEVSAFPDEIIFYNDFARLSYVDGLIGSIGWWDRGYWDQVSFIEDVYPK